MDNRRIFEFLNERLLAGLPCVLVTVISVAGSSMRDPGAHMAVCADGQFAGSLSGGCIENAVVAEAIDTLKNGAARITRFGAGSRYIDIKLPCDGGLDIHFLPLSLGVDGGAAAGAVADCINALRTRRPFSLLLPVQGAELKYHPGWRPLSVDPGGGPIVVGHHPAPRLLIIGHGAVVDSLHRLAGSMDLDTSILTSDAALAARLAARDADAALLRSNRDAAGLVGDPWTAIVFLFHDHDWEGHLIAHAAGQPHFYLGAMGGRRAHAARRGVLRDLGVTDEKIDGIRAPIGLYHSVRDPGTLALSAMAEIIQAYQNHDFTGAGLDAA